MTAGGAWMCARIGTNLGGALATATAPAGRSRLAEPAGSADATAVGLEFRIFVAVTEGATAAAAGERPATPAAPLLAAITLAATAAGAAPENVPPPLCCAT